MGAIRSHRSGVSQVSLPEPNPGYRRYAENEIAREAVSDE
jgi:hypothetical protein